MHCNYNAQKITKPLCIIGDLYIHYANAAQYVGLPPWNDTFVK